MTNRERITILSPDHLELARHALGLTRGVRSYRNHFVAGKGHPDHPRWMVMVAAGHAQRINGTRLSFGGDDLFRMTRSGADAALKPGEFLDLEDFPYGE